jgi:glutathione reductase (NADPH)
MYASRYRDELEDARGFGWSTTEPTLDWERLVLAKNRELDRLNGVYMRLLREASVEVMNGRGTIVDPHTVRVEGRQYTAKHILVATGGAPVLPALPGIEHAMTSNEALDLRTLPRRVVIVGGGYIGVELAGIFGTAGAHVTQLVRGDRVLRGFDEDLRSTLAEEMTKRGIDLRFGATVQSITREASGYAVRLESGEVLEADRVMFATGRAPNTRGIGLAEVGVALTDHGAVVVDDSSRTSVPSIFAIGDVTDRKNLTPVAIAEGRALAETLFHDNPTKMDPEGIPSAVFSQPPVSTVGMTEAQARKRHGAVDVYRTRFRPMKLAFAGRDEMVMMKLVVARASGRVLGVHMVGADAPEIIQGFAVALKCGARKADLDATIGIHPTIAEEFVTMRTPLPDPDHPPMD